MGKIVRMIYALSGVKTQFPLIGKRVLGFATSICATSNFSPNGLTIHGIIPTKKRKAGIKWGKSLMPNDCLSLRVPLT
jgi:hypothetical protein